MPPLDSSPQYEHGLPESLGVLLVNLGTPDDPTPAAVRRYLRQLLSDRRVVEFPRLPWLAVLHGYILRTRPAVSAKAYKKIWTQQGSPLLLHSMGIADAVQEKLSARLFGAVNVELAMSCGSPSIDSALQNLFDRNARRLVVLPLYPQYSSTTTGSVFDAVTALLSIRRWIPELHFINHYHDASGYISALATSIRDFWDLRGRGDRLLMSFHGLPQRTLLAGDPYHCQCQKTARLVAAALELDDDDWHISFQSRLGREPWLQPYTDETLKKWGGEKAGKIDVICPGFAADCLETLEEIEIRDAATFAAAGGGELRYIPALNARDDHVAFLSRTIEKNITGWPEASTDCSQSEATRQMEQSLQRARDLGAER
jgi:ferrochelatase